MRLHQCVGRLNRIGQHQVVKVMLFQNPDPSNFPSWTTPPSRANIARIKAFMNRTADGFEGTTGRHSESVCVVTSR
jgi:hypothetical protein